jgi:hypothetical protein
MSLVCWPHPALAGLSRSRNSCVRRSELWPRVRADAPQDGPFAVIDTMCSRHPPGWPVRIAAVRDPVIVLSPPAGMTPDQIRRGRSCFMLLVASGIVRGQTGVRLLIGVDLGPLDDPDSDLAASVQSTRSCPAYPGQRGHGRQRTSPAVRGEDRRRLPTRASAAARDQSGRSLSGRLEPASRSGAVSGRGVRPCRAALWWQVRFGGPWQAG